MTCWSSATVAKSACRSPSILVVSRRSAAMRTWPVRFLMRCSPLP